MSDLLFPSLFDAAERARWRMSDIPWADIDPARASREVRELVRLVALSEATTFSATKKFLSEMADDIDFTQWISVWFYEETKHPDVLMRYLAALGETVDARSVLRARVTAPFIRSRTGTLTMNVLSEMFAADGYRRLAEGSPEPVLRHIAALLARDEARHATSFRAYAARAIARAPDPAAEALQALKVLHYWVHERGAVEHPVNEARVRLVNDDVVGPFVREALRETSDVVRRACGVVGRLAGCALAGPEDVRPAIEAISLRVGASSRSG